MGTAAPGVPDIRHPSLPAARTRADAKPIVEAGAMAFDLEPDGHHYFDIHHTAADTLDKIRPDDLRRNAAAVALLASDRRAVTVPGGSHAARAAPAPGSARSNRAPRKLPPRRTAPELTR